MQQKIEKIIDEHIKRDGLESLKQFLAESDFYTAPASTEFHGSSEGKLAEHSLMVYKQLSKKNKDYLLGYSEETIAITGLFHDLCKTNFYKKSEEKPTMSQINYLTSLLKGCDGDTAIIDTLSKMDASRAIDHLKNGGTPETIPPKQDVWVVDDKLPIGHGEKSVYMIQKHIQLTDEEAIAIRWHMVAFDAGIHFNYPSGFPFRKSMKENKLLTILSASDMEVSNLLNI